MDTVLAMLYVRNIVMSSRNNFFYLAIFVVTIILSVIVYALFNKKSVYRNHEVDNISDGLMNKNPIHNRLTQVNKKTSLPKKNLAEKIFSAKLNNVVDKQKLYDLIYDKELTPSDGLELSKYIEKNITSLDVKADLLSAIISSLASNGFLEEAWGMIAEDVGKLRYSQITYFFSSSQEPYESLLSRLDHIHDVTDKTAALDGICNRLFIPFSVGDTTALLNADFSRLGNLTDQQKRQISSYFINYGAIPSHDGVYLPERTPEQKKILSQKSLELTKQGIMNLEDFRSVLGIISNNAFDNWELMNTSLHNRQLSDIDLMAFSEQVSDMAEQNPIKTIETLQKSSRPNDSYLIEVAVRRWLEYSAKDAGQWYSVNAIHMLPEHRERVALAYLRFGIQKGDVASASLWAEHILNPDLRSVVEAEIREALSR
ncbi:MAG: hypothetical protein EAZ42_03860 [Verrucomicrobia bacterium]|nr:MAG: hypothetical protein EAZ42_03860 [Verrucomicrobiota bacterium]